MDVLVILSVCVQEPTLSRVMTMMDAELVVTHQMTQSWDGTERSLASTPILTVDFGQFYRWWTDANGNFTDPKGFSDMATVVRPHQDLCVPTFNFGSFLRRLLRRGRPGPHQAAGKRPKRVVLSFLSVSRRAFLTVK